ncbi:MAG: adenosine deaminase [Thiotrichales bacterium]
MEIEKFIEQIPKAELHLHIEGTFEPELMFEIAQRNGVGLPYASVDELRKAYEFSELQDFLDIYYQGMNVLRTTQDYFDLTWAYIEKINAQNVRHIEIFFDPQGHTSRGVGFATVVEGIYSALLQGQRKFGISFDLIMCFLRHLDEEDAMKTLEESLPYRDKIIGVGLDSSELGHPPHKFQRVFEKARALGFHVVAHAGEEGPPEYVEEALNLLKVERIDHGNRALENQALVDRIVSEEIALTVCPLSNLKLCVVDDLKNHPIPKMLSLGVKATINSDDPAYFGGYMNENFQQLTRAVGLAHLDIEVMVKNSFEAAFINDVRRGELMAELNDFLRHAG